MITLHHLRIGRSIFTVWALEEVGADYDLKVYYRDPETFLAGDDLKQIHPLGKSPVIEDGDLVLAESGAITSYLLEKFDSEFKLSPPRSDLNAWATYNQWLHYPEASVFGPLFVKMISTRIETPVPVLDAFCARTITAHLDHITNQLSDNPYILGDEFSGADFGIAYVISMAERLGQLDNHPTLSSYLQRNQQRPAFLRAIERAVE